MVVGRGVQFPCDCKEEILYGKIEGKLCQRTETVAVAPQSGLPKAYSAFFWFMVIVLFSFDLIE